MAQHRKVLIAKAVNYGSSKTSTTVNTALNPADLADGAIGVYGIHTTGATNLNKLVLITDGGSEAAGKVPAASFAGTEVVIALGTSTGAILSNPIQKTSGIHGFSGKNYVAPVKSVKAIGYHPSYTSGLLGWDVPTETTSYGFKVTNRNSPISGFRTPFITETYTAEVLEDATAYDALVRLVNKVNALDTTSDRTLIDYVEISHNGTGAVFTTTATVAAVNGATSLTTSAAHGVGVGDYISLGGDLYKCITGTASTTLVLDRPYGGATATIANADTLDLGSTVPTQLGLQITDQEYEMNNSIQLLGGFETATTGTITAVTFGIGTYEYVREVEKEFRAMLGTADEIHSYIPKEPYKADSTLTYDQYSIKAKNSNLPTGGNGSVFRVELYTLLFFPVLADTAGFNQSDFEDIMSDTNMFGTSFPSISA